MNNTTSSHFNTSAAEEEKLRGSIFTPIFWISFGFLGHTISLLFLKLTSKSHKWKPFYRFVAALTLTDFYTILSSPSIAIVQHVNNFTFTASPGLCQYFSFSSSFGILSSGLIICFMSFDRYKAITKPILYHTQSHSRRTTVTFISIWLVSGCICALPLLGLGSARHYKDGCWCFIDFLSCDTKDLIYTYIYSITCLLVIVSTLSMNCVVIAFLCRKSSGDDVEATTGRKQNLSIVFLMIIFVLSFCVCLTPLTVRMLMSAIIDIGGYTGTGAEELNLAITAMSNGIIDPWIYILLRKENIQTCFKCIRCRQSLCKSEESSNEIAKVTNSNVSKSASNSSSTLTADIHI